MLLISALAVGVLMVIVVSVAWFTSNPQVDANEVSLSSAKTLSVAFDSTNYKSNYSYDGQDGITEDAYDYSCGYFKVNISNSSNDKRGIVKLDFSTVQMECAICTVKDILIEDLFQTQICCYKEKTNGEYELEKQNETDPYYNVFRNVGAGNGHYELIADDYYLGNNNYLYRTSTQEIVLLQSGLYFFAFTYTFFPEGGGYVPDEEGDYIGQVSYVRVKGSKMYAYSNGNYTQNDNGDYCQVVSDYVDVRTNPSAVTKYKKISDNNYTPDDEGTYIKIKNHLGNDLSGNTDDDFVQFRTYSLGGFPYASIRYQGAKYVFSIVCSVEEV